MTTDSPTPIRQHQGYWIAACVIMLIITIPVIRWAIPESHGMTVTFHNSSDLIIDSIELDFGNSNSQSSIRAFRIPVGAERAVLLNHEPGMGFNVKVNYQGGISQSFCALRGDDQRDPILYLKP